jgi:hypothetical protein
MPESVQFEDDSSSSDPSTDILNSNRQGLGQSESPTMIGLVKKWKLAETDTQAYYILIAVIILCFVVAGVIMAHFVFNIGKSKKPVYNVSPAVKAKLPPELQRSINTSQNP